MPDPPFSGSGRTTGPNTKKEQSLRLEAAAERQKTLRSERTEPTGDVEQNERLHSRQPPVPNNYSTPSESSSRSSEKKIEEVKEKAKLRSPNQTARENATLSSHAHAAVTPPSKTASRLLTDNRNDWAAKDTCERELTCNSDTASCTSFRTCNTYTVSCTFELSKDIAFIKSFLGDQPVTALLGIEDGAAFQKNGIHKVCEFV